MAPYIGRRMRRVEDERLITGKGRYAGDIKLDGLVHVAFCRSVLPHALILSIDASTAKAMPGVLAIWTAADLPEVADGLSDWGPEDMIAKGRPILNRDEVNYAGEAFAGALGLDDGKVRVVAEDVGGGFGAKGSAFPEEVLTAIAAWRLKRPAQWIASRSEDGATTAQGHGSVIELEIASDRAGKLRGLRGNLIHDLGAYAGSGAGQPDIIVSHMLSAYVLPAMEIESQLVYTNAVPSGFIRGGGRPLGNYAMERVMDRLARELDISPAEVRRRNMVEPEQIPFTTGYPAGRHGLVYDSGDYPRLLELTLEKLGDVSQNGTDDGRLVGVGIACCVESTGFGRGEPARLRVNKDGSAELFIGSTPQGQGHQTMAAQVAADRLGWPKTGRATGG